jgi:hypothetical protein
VVCQEADHDHQVEVMQRVPLLLFVSGRWTGGSSKPLKTKK